MSVTPSFILTMGILAFSARDDDEWLCYGIIRAISKKGE